MTLISAFEAKRLIEGGEAKVGSYFRHWSTQGLYVVLDLGKSSAYAVLNWTWERVFRNAGILRGGN